MPIHNAKTAKAVVIGVSAALATVLLLLCVISGVMLMLPTIPKAALPYVMLAADAVGVLIGGYIAAAISGSKGLVMGLICGIIVFLIQLAIGLLTVNAEIGVMTFARFGTAAVCGMLGGIKGVNRKEKLHIK